MGNRIDGYFSEDREMIFLEFEELDLDVERDFCVNGVYYDFLLKNGDNELLVNYNTVISDNVIYSFEYLLGLDANNLDILPKRKHLEDSLNAERNGCELIQWFEHYDKDKMFDLILSKLGKNKRVIGARKCIVKEIDSKKAKDFINKYHLLNLNIKQDVNLALFYEDEIVSLMSFKKLKNTKENINLTNNRLDDSWELFRYCNKKNYTVCGGASKLFKYFLTNYKPSFVKTVSDYNLGSGNIYNNLGFKQIKNPRPSCFWSHLKDGKIFINNNTVLLGADRIVPKYIDDYFYVGTDERDFINRNGLDFYGKWPGNKDIMLHYGFVEIYDSGYKTWIYKSDIK